MLTATGGVLLLLAAVLTVVPSPANAVTTPTITPLDGNPTCQDVGYTSGAKIEDPPETGTYPGDGRTFEEGSDALTVTIVAGTATSFSFEGADPAIKAVIVKSGGNPNDLDDEKALLYEFDPAVTAAGPIYSVTKGDIEVLRDISHVQFCWGETAPRPTVEKRWYASNGTTQVDAPTTSNIEVTVDVVEGKDIVLEHGQLDDGSYTVPVAASNVAGVDETQVPTGWTEFACDANTEDDAYVVCNKQVEDDENATLKKLWFDSDGDLRAAPSSGIIEITVDLDEGQDVVLELDDLDDGLVTLPVGVEGVRTVEETIVPSGWREVECAAQYDAQADYVICNRRRSSGGGGGGDLPTPVTTPITTAPILPLTPEMPAEVLPEVVTTPAPAPAPVLPFTGTGRMEAMAVTGLAFVLAGGMATLLARRRPEVEAT